jgi:hypothetical protein
MGTPCAMADDSPRSRYLKMLMSHVSQDTYPSTSQMDNIERMADPDQAAVFADLLIAKMEAEKYPSIPLMHRLERVLSRLG